jgi:Cof subfamily protein (haloacid dehalogenase superfamily)
VALHQQRQRWKIAMTPSMRFPSAKISAVVSDVDGTLVTNDKKLSARTQAAVADLHARGIIFTIISSRPPRGLHMLLESLEIATPIGGFNGGVIARPDLSVITAHVLPSQVARSVVDMLTAHRAQPWVFAGREWVVHDSEGPYVKSEERTVRFEPTIAEDFGPALDIAAKIVGVSADFELLARCEHDVRVALAGEASVARSQPYYLDITHPLANKGAALSELAMLLAIPLAEIAVIGDGGNDIAMFERSGLSIAMGNASPQVRQAADCVTDSNHDEGFANAIERFILGGDRSEARADIAGAGGSV